MLILHLISLSYLVIIVLFKTKRSDQAHVKRIQDWYQKYGGRECVYKDYILEVRNEAIESTVK